MAETGNKNKPLNFCELINSWDKKTPMYEIYQIRKGSPSEDITFFGTNILSSLGRSVDGADYDIKYAALIEGFYEKDYVANDFLDEIYAELNQKQPFDYRGHSLSVSDIIVLRSANYAKAFYVDNYGFSPLPDFFEQRAMIKDPLENIYDDKILNRVIARRNLYYGDNAFQIGSKYFEIHETEDGFDYSFYDSDFRLIDGGVITNPDMNETGRDAMYRAAQDTLLEKGLSLNDIIPVNAEILEEEVQKRFESDVALADGKNRTQIKMKESAGPGDKKKASKR